VERHAPLVLFAGVMFASTGAILIRLADAPALVTAAWRLIFACAIVVPAALVFSRSELTSLGRSDVRAALLSGVALAAHFALWVSSLDHTSVASSVILVTTSPLWVALAAPFVLGEGVKRAMISGIAIAFCGGLVIGWGDLMRGGGAFLGDLLALGGAWAAAAYFMLGRRLRSRLSLLAYVALVYGAAALMLVAAALAVGNHLFGYPTETWIAFILLGVFPQSIGHTSFNWALQHLSSTFVAGASLAEPLGSTTLAWAVLDEPPPPATVLGGALILLGLGVAARAESNGAASLDYER
jgi:drug/metabolite transporter (DMT)-like permease